MLTLLLACAPEPAPRDVDDLVRLLWTDFDVADDALLAEAAGNLPREDQEGELTRLAAEDVAHLDRGAVDTSAARGWYVVYRFTCSLDRLEAILAAQDQADQYPDAGYTSYERTYTSSLEAFEDGTSDTVSWEVDLSGEYLNTAYDEHLIGGLRRTPDLRMARTWIPDAVQFEEGSDWSWPQDYQIEAWVQDGDEVIHTYGIWRELDVGITTENDGLVNTTMNGMRDWDDRTAELCAE